LESRCYSFVLDCLLSVCAFACVDIDSLLDPIGNGRDALCRLGITSNSIAFECPQERLTQKRSTAHG
jgi:hypothetical protein